MKKLLSMGLVLTMAASLQPAAGEIPRQQEIVGPLMMVL